tara:strand:- start:555 stop:674 length:120 start_codon:yes stop_codon:yes gene_type:complete
VSQPQAHQKRYSQLKDIKKYEKKKKEQTIISQRKSKEDA